MDKKPSKSKGHLTPLKHPAVEALVSYSLQDARVRDGHQRITTGHLTPLKHPAVEASTLQSQHNCRRGPRFLLKTCDYMIIISGSACAPPGRQLFKEWLDLKVQLNDYSSRCTRALRMNQRERPQGELAQSMSTSAKAPSQRGPGSTSTWPLWSLSWGSPCSRLLGKAT